MAQSATVLARSELNVVATLLLLLLVLLIGSDLVHLSFGNCSLQTLLRAFPLFLRFNKSQRLYKFNSCRTQTSKMKSSSLFPILMVGRLTFFTLRFWVLAFPVCTGCLWFFSLCIINNCMARAPSNSGVLYLAPLSPSLQEGLVHSREQVWGRSPVAVAKTPNPGTVSGTCPCRPSCTGAPQAWFDFFVILQKRDKPS